MTIFALMSVLMMLVVGGLGVDLMQQEMERTQRQNTLDRAILAAADLDQLQDPGAVVNDYYSKSGYSEVVNVNVEEGINFRTVTASARIDMPTRYMSMVGTDDLPIWVGGSATEWVPNLEISLVLDISGSMRNSSRMDNLRPAARNFVSSVLEGDMAQHTSINLIPYAGQTNVGPFMFNRLNGQRYAEVELPEGDGGIESNSSWPQNTSWDNDEDEYYVFPNVTSCLELQSDDFTHARLPERSSYDQVPHFMYWPIAASVMDWGWCPYDATSIQYAQNNETALHNFINGMRMHDGTGTAYGMKYALALLDPTSQDDFAAMSSVGLVPSQYSSRPANWTDTETAKYIVLMTDGQITDQWRPKNGMHEDNVDIALKKQDSSRKEKIHSASTNVNRFYAICDLAKAEPRNIVIYTIAFEAPSGAKTQMRNCASSPSHFFDVQGSEIDEVFQSIARQVRQLRLVY